MPIIDLSQPLFQGQPVYPGHPPTLHFPVTTVGDLPGGKKRFAVNGIMLSEHAGTHTDAFIHMDDSPGAESIDVLALSRFMGRGICLDVSSVPAGSFIEPSHLQQASAGAGLEVRPNTTVLLYTGHYGRVFPAAEYNQRYAGLNRAGAEWLADRGAINIGIDTPAVDVAPHQGDEWKPAHNVCRERKIFNSENYGELSEVAGKEFLYIGLPLRIQRGTAGPTRAVAIVGEGTDALIRQLEGMIR